jgi:hypothetical protein
VTSPDFVQTSIVVKSIAPRTSQWTSRNSFQVDLRLRSRTGSIPWSRRMLPTVVSEISCPRLARAPWMRSWPHAGFSRPMRNTSSMISGRTRGRPTARRRSLQVHFSATSCRCPRRMVSGEKAAPTSPRSFRDREEHVPGLENESHGWYHLGAQRTSIGERNGRSSGQAAESSMDRAAATESARELDLG